MSGADCGKEDDMMKEKRECNLSNRSYLLSNELRVEEVMDLSVKRRWGLEETFL